MRASANPFLMMMDPESILQAVERSERLNSLARKVCRPLDKPLIPRCDAIELDAYDRAIEMEHDVEIEEMVVAAD